MRRALPAVLFCIATLSACGGGTGNSGFSAFVAPPVPDDAPALPPLGAYPEPRPWSDALAAGTGHTIVGDVRVIDNFPMPQLGKVRRIWIYLPAEYSASTARYPVLYLNDGQNVFDTATSYAGEWGVDEAMMQLEADPELRTIVVAIDNGGADRTSEYLASARAGSYVEFLVHTLKPYIDSHFRTKPEREHTAIGGSSYGATVSLYAGLTRQDVFGKIAAFSNVTLYDGADLTNTIVRAGHPQNLRIYMDIGALEEAQFPGVLASDRQIYQQLLDTGLSAEQVKLLIDPQGAHGEAAWRRRFPAAWRWLNAM